MFKNFGRRVQKDLKDIVDSRLDANIAKLMASSSASIPDVRTIYVYSLDSCIKKNKKNFRVVISNSNLL